MREIRCFTRRAVSRFVFQLGSKHAMTSAEVIASTRLCPILGIA